MSLPYQRVPRSRLRPQLSRALALLAVALLACTDGKLGPTPSLIHVSEVIVNDAAAALERGTSDTLTATVLDSDGDTVVVPVVWRSSNEGVARFTRGGVLLALDTGTTSITATTLGVQSQAVGFAVVWFGPAAIDSGAFAPPNARGPGVALTDSVRVIVTNTAGTRVANARVRFTVTDGGGTVSPATDSTDANGVAATRWTLGPVAGQNVLTASVIRTDGALDTLVVDNLVTFVINSYNALTAQSGDNQSAQLLATLPVAPSVRLVDSLGAPRAGVPVTFTASANGRVASPIVSTGADGVASPGAWTLGEVPGPQTLEARVEDARAVLTATATGTPIFYTPLAVTAGAFSTCARENGGVVKCWGAEAQLGLGDTTDIFTPTTIHGGIVASSVVAGHVASQAVPSLVDASHTCALNAAGSVWCWGWYALVDTTGATPHAMEPTQLQSALAWSQISAGRIHTCAITQLEDAYCWGINSASSGVAGQLGDGTATDRFAPTPVAGGFKFSRIASGSNHTCALNVGTAYCWGQSAVGQVGDGTNQPRNTPTAVIGGHTFESVGVGAGISCALTPQPEGRVYCWGSISGTSQPTPITYPSAPAFTALSVGGSHACALTSDATAYCWGANNFGQLGDSSQVRRNTPTKVAGDLRFTQVSAGFLHTCGITTAGAVACWGNNRSGELGDTTAAFRTRPRHVILGVTP